MTNLRVLICDDSRTYAAALMRTLEHDGDITVLAVCPTAELALTMLRHERPDVLTMDLELPGMDGLAAVAEVMAAAPVPILVLSAHYGAGSDRAAAAAAAGALDAAAKEDLDLRDPAGAQGTAFRRRVWALSRARVIRHPGARLAAPAGPLGLARRASVIGICASVGGPPLLASLLGALPASYPIPVLIVQHMAVGFTDGLASWLDDGAALPVGVATAGPIAPGAWLAPDSAHLAVTAAGRMDLDRRTVAGPHRPSGDVLLRSIAAAAGRAGVAIVLSGMGSDGADGAAAVRHAGGLAIAQDQGSAAVFGMPKAAIDLGVQTVLPPAEIIARLLSLRPGPLAGAS